MLGKTLKILGLLLILSPTSSQAETRLESLVWEDGVLVLGFNGPFESDVMVLNDPDRIVMDFPEVRSDLRAHEYAGTGDLERIRVGQNEVDEQGGQRVRVVMDLRSAHDFRSENGGRFLRVMISPGKGQDLGSRDAHRTIALAESAPEVAPVLAPEPDYAARPQDDADSEMPIVVESAELPAPPSETLAAAQEPMEQAVAHADLMSAGFNAMLDLPADEPAAAVKAVAPPTPAMAAATETSPDALEADTAPADWQDSVLAEFARLSEASATEPAAPEPAPTSVAAVANEPAPAEPASATTQAVDDPARDAEAVFYGDPFEMSDVPADAVEHPLATPAVKTEETPAPSPATPARLDTGLDQATVRTASASAMAPQVAVVSPSVAADTPRETLTIKTAPEIAFAAYEAEENSATTTSLRVAMNEPPKNAAPKAKPVAASGDADARTRLRAAFEAGHERVKPDAAAISLEMRGAEFSTLLRAFSEFANVNIVAGREVKGKVSVNLKEIPWREALSAVCNAHGYAVKEEHGVLRVGPRGSMLQEEMELLSADKKRSEYRPLDTAVVKLAYALAEELKGPLDKMLSERGKMDVDNRTNSLLITDLPEVVEQLVALAHDLDQLMPQVEITARIVDVDYYASRDLGIKWEALNLVNSDAGLVGSGTVNAVFPDPIGELKMAKVQDWGELNMTLQALEKENKANIISTPRVTTMDNREANILVGKKIPLIVADEAGNAITQLTTIGIKMVVTPHINPDGKIMMHVLTEVSDLSSEATVQGGVIITTSESNTNVMVDDGQTAVIAGLIKSSDSSLDNQVPFLGKIPILGRLFGYNNTAQNKRELIIFITPRVINSGASNSAEALRDAGFTVPFGD